MPVAYISLGFDIEKVLIEEKEKKIVFSVFWYKFRIDFLIRDTNNRNLKFKYLKLKFRDQSSRDRIAGRCMIFDWKEFVQWFPQLYYYIVNFQKSSTFRSYFDTT